MYSKLLVINILFFCVVFVGFYMVKFRNMKSKKAFNLKSLMVVKTVLLKIKKDFLSLSLKSRLLRVALVAILVFTIGLAVSKADTIASKFLTNNAPNKNFSAIGVVSDIATTTLSIEKAKGTDDKSKTSYTFYTDTVLKIETKSYVPLTLSDINIGDKIVVQGIEKDQDIIITRIISLWQSTSTKATSTEETASTTEETATSTATSTDPGLIDKIKDVFSGILDVLTGSSTATTTSTTTPATDTSTTTATSSSPTGVEATTTPDSASSTNPTTGDSSSFGEGNTTSLLDNVINAVQGAVDKVMGNGSGDTTTPPVDNSAPAPESVTQ